MRSLSEIRINWFALQRQVKREKKQQQKHQQMWNKNKTIFASHRTRTHGKSQFHKQ